MRFDPTAEVYVIFEQPTYVGYFASLLHPREAKFGCYHELGTCLGGKETHVVLVSVL